MDDLFLLQNYLF